MKPDHQDNYWQRDPNEAESDAPTGNEELGMYEPDQTPDEDVETNNDPKAKSARGQTTPAADEPVHWSANEYINEEKNWLWFVVFTVVVLAFISIDLFLLKSYTFSALVIVMAIAVIIFSRRPPRSIDYTLSGNQGLYIGEKLYHFNEFKAFGLIKDQDHHSIMLIPIKRFAPGVSVYFPEEVGEKIVDILGSRLPMENLKLDIIDVVVRKLRL